MKKVALGAFKIAFLFCGIVISLNAFSSGIVQKMILKRMVKGLTYQKPSIVTPKRIEKFTFWTTLLAPTPYRFSNEKKQRQEINSFKSLPKNEKIDEFIQKTLSIDPSMIIVLADEEFSSGPAYACEDKIVIAQSLYKKLASDDELERDKITGILGHEYGHIKKGHTKRGAIFLTGIELCNVAIMAIIGKAYSSFRIGKKIIQNKQKIRSFIAAPIKGFLKSGMAHISSLLIFYKTRRVGEYEADNIYVPNGSVNIKLLKGLKSDLSEEDYYTYLKNVKGLTENEISFQELFVSHPNTEKRIKRIDEHIKRLELEEKSIKD